MPALVKFAYTLLIGSIGGFLFMLAGLPLPWMLGSMLFAAIGAIAGQPFAVPAQARTVTTVVVGTMLGTSFTPDMFAHIGDWFVSLAGLAAFIATSTIITYFYFHRLVKLDPATALFASMPGGLIEMVVMGHAKGADDRTIALLHAARVFLVIMIVPLMVQFFGGLPTIAVAPPAAETGLSVIDLVWFAGVAAAGWGLGVFARLPVPFLFGPLLISGAVHIFGWTEFKLPGEAFSAAQLVLGSAVGCRFVGAPLRELLRILLLSSGSIAILLALTLLFGMLVSTIAGLPLLGTILAYSPGGLAEMGFIALSLDIEVAFVITHHLIRVLIVVAGAEFAYRALMRLTSGKTLPL